MKELTGVATTGGSTPAAGFSSRISRFPRAPGGWRRQERVPRMLTTCVLSHWTVDTHTLGYFPFSDPCHLSIAQHCRLFASAWLLILKLVSPHDNIWQNIFKKLPLLLIKGIPAFENLVTKRIAWQTFIKVHLCFGIVIHAPVCNA